VIALCRLHFALLASFSLCAFALNALILSDQNPVNTPVNRAKSR